MSIFDMSDDNITTYFVRNHHFFFNFLFICPQLVCLYTKKKKKKWHKKFIPQKYLTVISLSTFAFNPAFLYALNNDFLLRNLSKATITAN